MTKTRRDVTCLVAGLALLLTGAVAAEMGPGMAVRTADVQLVQDMSGPVTLVSFAH